MVGQDNQGIKRKKNKFDKARLNLGAIVLILGFLSTLLIPFVTNSDWSTIIKSILSGLLAFGIPELFMIIAIAIMGKDGYNYLKRLFSVLFWRYGPPNEVSLLRYRIGLVMFIVPIIISIIAPYFGSKLVYYEDNKTIIMLVFHFMLLMSLFVLGGDFWEKLRGLFNRKAKINMESLKK